MPRRVQTKARRVPAHEIKGAGLVIWALILPVFLWACLGLYNQINRAYWNAQYIKLGQAVDCRTRPNPHYLANFCDIEADGDSCGDDSRNRLQIWHEPIDFACAQHEPDRVFRFDVSPPELEYAEQG